MHDTTFYVDKDKGYLITLEKIEPATLPALDTIYDVVANDVYEERAYKKMVEDAVQLKKKIRMGDHEVL